MIDNVVEKIKRAGPLYGDVYEAMWASILSGQLEPGERIHDTVWASKLNVSRTPIREALRKLEHEGMLLPMPHGGYRVREVTAEDLRKLYQCRAALEGLAAHQAAANLTAAQIRQLGNLIVSAQKKIENYDFENALKLNTRFHESIIISSGNEHLIRLTEIIHKIILFNRFHLMKISYASDIIKKSYHDHLLAGLQDHHNILEALSEKDGPKSEHEMRVHTMRTMEAMIVLFQMDASN